MNWMDEIRIMQQNEKKKEICYCDVEIYFDDDLVYSWREVSFEELKTMIKVTKTIYTKLYFVKNKCKGWNYKVVIN